MEHNSTDQEIQRRLAKRLGAPPGTGNGNYCDGNYTVEAKSERKWLRGLLRMFAKTGERLMTECSGPIVEATDTTKAKAADEVTISEEPATTDEVSPQKTVIEVPKETARKRRATRASHRNAQAELVAAFLRLTLTGGPVRVAELQVKARAAGLLGDRQTVTNSKKFRAGKAALNIRSYRIGFGAGSECAWALPDVPGAALAGTVAHPSPDVPAVSVIRGGDACQPDVGTSTVSPRSNPDGAPNGDAPNRRIPLDWV
jgi:hypothetical protein